MTQEMMKEHSAKMKAEMARIQLVKAEMARIQLVKAERKLKKPLFEIPVDVPDVGLRQVMRNLKAEQERPIPVSIGNWVLHPIPTIEQIGAEIAKKKEEAVRNTLFGVAWQSELS